MKIKVIDEMNAEDVAMLQALYSRSKDSVENHLKKVEELGSGKFMDQYYIGYGHKSIADCGSFTIFIEGISDLAVKAFQNWQLYNGQQSSTRYIDFLTTPEEDMKDEDIKNHFYCDKTTKSSYYRTHIKQYQAVLSLLTSEEYIINLLKDRNEDVSLAKDERFLKAYKPKALDVARHFLPVGVLTNFSWHTNLRQAKDLLEWLEYHELEAVRNTVKELKEKLQAKFKNSFQWNHSRREKNYRTRMMEEFYFGKQRVSNYLNVDVKYTAPVFEDDYRENKFGLEDYFLHMKKHNNSRPYGTELMPFNIDPLSIAVSGKLDIGAFRDLQRHRALKFNFPYYYTTTSIKSDIRETVLKTLDGHDLYNSSIMDLIDRFKHEYLGKNEYSPYVVPMGIKVMVIFQGGLKALTYLIEIRSKSTVHPTLRAFIDDLYSALLRDDTFVKYAPNIHFDNSKNRLVDTYRGTQDIVKKEN